jgi:hypothetical protein
MSAKIKTPRISLISRIIIFLKICEISEIRGVFAFRGMLPYGLIEV